MFQLNLSLIVLFIIYNFIVHSGEFVAVHAAYQSHIGEDAFLAPQAKLADGVIWLLIIKAGITRTNMLQVVIFSLIDFTSFNNYLQY